MSPSTVNIHKFSRSITDVSFENDADTKANGQKASAKLVQRKGLYIYVDHSRWGIVWSNVVFYSLLHLLYLCSWYVLLKERRLNAFILGATLDIWARLGVTAGAHRLWSHKAYKARLPLRIFLMIGQSLAGQNDIFTWSRDHRVHHKYSETDADPHNALRGFFFAHMGWLMVKKHPNLIERGKELPIQDLLNDPVVKFQRKYYSQIYLFLAIFLPTALSVYLWNETWTYSFLVATVMRYTTSLHITWFVNSTAHMFGNRPYNLNINPRENSWVSFGALGEGYHNYHHTFPWDYATSESGALLNPTKWFIEIMALFGLAYDLRQVSDTIIEERKLKVNQHLASNNENQ